jgi:hypothetical protein
MDMTAKPKRPNKGEHLLAAIQAISADSTAAAAIKEAPPPAEAPDHPRELPPAPAVTTGPQSVTPPAVRARPRTAKPVKNRLSPSQYWLYDEDRRIIREIAAWLAGQGERPTDGRIIRAVLQTVRIGPELFKGYRHTVQMDARLKTHKTHKAHESVDHQSTPNA